jgi:hypothetical protein
MEGACVDGGILLKWMGGTEWINLAQCYGTMHMVMHVTSSIKYRPITCYEDPDREQNYSSTSSLTCALDWGLVFKATPRLPYTRVWPGTRWTGGCAGLRAELEWCGKFDPTGIRSLDPPACSESLYRLSYPGPPPSSIIWKCFLTLEQDISMGSPISSLIAEIFLQHYEDENIKQLLDTKNIAFYMWYIDSLVIFDTTNIDLHTINTYILYIKMNVCLFVWNLYKFTFLNRSGPNFAHVSPLVWRRS